MINFYAYEPTGRIVMVGVCPPGQLPYQRVAGATVDVGVVDLKTQYRSSDGEIIPIPEQPSEYHVWDWVTLSWNQDRTLAEKAVRAKRGELLRNVVDTINAVRWAAMDDAKKAEWNAYRTALLDITDQVGFPFDVVWPCVPA